MGKNLIQRQQEEIRRYIRAARLNEQTFCCDIATIALGRLGWGEKRLTEFEKAFSEAYEEYDILREEDGKSDKEGVYYKECIDRELKRYTGSKFTPYNERHYLT